MPRTSLTTNLAHTISSPIMKRMRTVGESGAADPLANQESVQLLGDSDFPTPKVEAIEKDFQAMEE